MKAKETYDYLQMVERRNKEFEAWVKNVMETGPTKEQLEIDKRIREIEAEYSYDGRPANIYSLIKQGIVTKEQIYG